jgi:hypothetical protein
LVARNSRSGDRRRRQSTRPLDLWRENGDFHKTYALDYHEGPKYAQLERIAGAQDLLTQILEPRKPAK